MKFGIPGLVLVFSKTQLQSKEKIVLEFTTQVDENLEVPREKVFLYLSSSIVAKLLIFI